MTDPVVAVLDLISIIFTPFLLNEPTRDAAE
jgi:hypothetical protein